MVADEGCVLGIGVDTEARDAVALAVQLASMRVGSRTHRSPGAVLEVDVSGELGVVGCAGAIVHLLSKPEELAAVVDEVVAIGILRGSLIGTVSTEAIGVVQLWIGV